MGAPTTWTYAGIVLPTSVLPSGSTQWGNACVAKDGGTYYMIIEYFDSANHWQLTNATSATATGTFTMAGPTPMTTTYPAAAYHSTSGAFLSKENGQWVLYYHANNVHNGLSLGFRATAPSLGSDNWTVLGQSGESLPNPFIWPVSQFEVEQCADLCWVAGPSGERYAFWTGTDLRTSTQRIMGARLLAQRKVWNGSIWEPDEPTLDFGRGILFGTRPTIITMGSDFSGSATSFAQLIGTNWMASGTDIEIEISAVVTATGASGVYEFQGWGNGGATKVSMGGVYLIVGQQTPVTLKCVITKMPVGQWVAYQVYYQCPAGGTLNCRPVAQAGIEKLGYRLADIAYRFI
jgi:hypothetical protein